MARIDAGGETPTDEETSAEQEPADSDDGGEADGDTTASEPSTEEEKLKEGFKVDTLKDETPTRRERTPEESGDPSEETTAAESRDTDTGSGGGFDEETLKEETTTRREQEASDDAEGGGDGLTDAQRQEMTADVAAVSSDLRRRLQGAEAGAGAVAMQARALEQRVLDAYSQLDESDVAVTREGEMLRAGLTATGREAFGINPTQRELATRRREVSRQLGGAVDAYEADRGRASELSQAAEIERTVAGIRRAVDATGQEFDRVASTPGPVGIEDLRPGQQDRVNEALIQQYSQQKGAFERRQELADAEQFGGTSAPERFLRAASMSYSEFVEDATTFGEENNLTFAVRPASTAGPFPGTVSVATLENEGDSQRARATRGLATGGAEVFNAPAYGVLGIEAGEIAVAGGQAAARGEFGGYEDVAGVGTDVIEYAGIGDEADASAADRDPAIDENFVQELGTAGIGLTDRVVTTAQEQPARFGGQLVGGTAAASGALTATKAVAGPRAAGALDVAFDPATPVTSGLRRTTRRAGARARRAADDFVGAERGQFTPGTKLEVETERETQTGKEAMIEVEEGSEVEAAMLAEREAFLERTRVKEGGEMELNTEAGRYDIGETRMEQERARSEAETAEERLPPASEFETEAAYQAELEAMRSRIEAESEADADAAAGVETTSSPGMETAAVLTGGSLATTTEADVFDTPTEEADATVQPFATQDELTETAVDVESETAVETDLEMEQDVQQEQTLDQELNLELEQEQELEQEFEQESELNLEQELELELEQEQELETEVELEFEAESEAELEMEAVDEDMLEMMAEMDSRDRKAGLFENDVIAPEELDDLTPVD